jgi:hypothetical protein
MVLCMSEFMWRIEQLVTAVIVMRINNRNTDRFVTFTTVELSANVTE